MKKIFTLLAAAAVTLSAAAETMILSNEGKEKDNPLAETQLNPNAEGWELSIVVIDEDGAISLRSDKTLQSGNTIEIDGTAYRTIKFSNGAWNQLILPEGIVATGVTFYTVINDDNEDVVNYWSSVNGVDYYVGDEPVEGKEPTVRVTSLKDFADPTICSFKFKDKVQSFLFKNSGKQPLAVLVVEYEKGAPSSICGVAADVENAQMYNVLGQPVDSNFKGLVIKNGKKFINK